MLENYIDVIEASRILDVHPETVKRLIRVTCPPKPGPGSTDIDDLAAVPIPWSPHFLCAILSGAESSTGRSLSLRSSTKVFP